MNAAEAFIPKHSDLECGIAAEASLYRKYWLKKDNGIAAQAFKPTIAAKAIETQSCKSCHYLWCVACVY